MTSLIVPVYTIDQETEDLCRDALRTIVQTDLPIELIVVDDGSTFRSDEFMRDNADLYIRHRQNRGYAGAVNSGLKAARGEQIFIMSSDVRMPPNWLEPLVRIMEEDKTIGGISPTAGSPGIIACTWGMRRDVFERVGLFDEQYKQGYYEDTDYYWRIKKLGLKLRYIPEVKIWHAGGATIHKVGGPVHSEENKQRFIKKWGFNPDTKPFTNDQ